MKTYEQMARDVLRRIDDINVSRLRRRQNTLRASIAVSCAVLTVLAGASIPSFMPKESTASSEGSVAPIATSVLRIAYLSKNGWEYSTMAEQIETQIRYKLSVIDVRDMTATQRENLHNQLIQEQGREMSRHDSVFRNGGWSVNSGWGNATFVLLRGGSFQLDIQEGKSISSVCGECTSGYGEVEFGIRMQGEKEGEISYLAEWGDGKSASMKKLLDNGSAYLHAKKVTLDGTTVAEIQQNGKYHIRWRPSYTLYDALNENPNEPISRFSDEMELTVHYTDGTREVHRIVMVFCDDGNISAIYQGVNVME